MPSPVEWPLRQEGFTSAACNGHEPVQLLAAGDDVARTATEQTADGSGAAVAPDRPSVRIVSTNGCEVYVNCQPADAFELHVKLEIAIVRQGVKDVKALIQAGASVFDDFYLDDFAKDTGNALDLMLLHKRYELALQLLNFETPSGQEVARGCNRALAWAAREGRLPILELLVTHGANIAQQDEQKRSALLLAAMRGQGQCVNVLLGEGALELEQDGGTEVNKWALHWKLQTHLALHWKRCVWHGLNQPAVADGAIEDSREAVVTQQPDGETDSNLSCRNGLQLRLQNAIVRSGVKEVKELLKKGAPLGAMYDLDELGKQTGSVLDLAVLHKRYDLALHLSNYEDSKSVVIPATRHAVAWAARDGKDNLVQELIRLGADVAQRDEKGRSALQLAALRGRKTCAQTLLAAGAWETESQREEVSESLLHWKLDDVIPCS